MFDTIAINECPVCSQPNTQSGHDNDTSIYKISTTINQKPFDYIFKVVKCSNCALFYKNNIPNYTTLNEYYEQLDTSYENTITEFPTDRIVTDFITQHSSTTTTVLDYGCGSGRLLNRLPSLIQKYGVEINQEAVRAAQQRNISIIDEAHLKTEYANYFDFIILTDVYEHLYKPLDLIQDLVGLLKKEGRLIIVTGNADAIKLQKHLGGYWYFQLFSHLQMLTTKHIQWVAQKINVSIEKLITTSHYNTSDLSKIKHHVAIIVFSAYQYFKTILPFVWALPKLKNVKNWVYPLFDTVNKDHLVIFFKKM